MTGGAGQQMPVCLLMFRRCVIVMSGPGGRVTRGHGHNKTPGTVRRALTRGGALKCDPIYREICKYSWSNMMVYINRQYWRGKKSILYTLLVKL